VTRAAGRTRRSGSAPRSRARLLEIYDNLHAAYGGDTWHWSPDYVRGPMDVIAGAILVQHTAWTNAERALEALRADGALDPTRLASLSDEELVQLIRVSGTPTVKARRLRAMAETIAGAGGLDALLALTTDDLRARLLATHGIGRETADAIMLYAAARRVFVVDAYTRRLFRRLGLGPGPDAASRAAVTDGYTAWQCYFEDRLDGACGAETFQRYHAYIVLHAKAACRAVPRCAGCPLLDLCATGRALTAVQPTRGARRR
jgi:endonuclease-3 related protein